MVKALGEMAIGIGYIAAMYYVVTYAPKVISRIWKRGI